jgi:hypothetical protein
VLVDFAHRESVDPGFADNLPFVRVNRPNPDQGDVFWLHFRAEPQDILQIVVALAQQVGEWHAVNVAAR